MIYWLWISDACRDFNQYSINVRSLYLSNPLTSFCARMLTTHWFSGINLFKIGYVLLMDDTNIILTDVQNRLKKSSGTWGGQSSRISLYFCFACDWHLRIWLSRLCFERNMSFLLKGGYFYSKWRISFLEWEAVEAVCVKESLYHFSFIASPCVGRDWEISVGLDDFVHWIFTVIVDNKEEFLSWGNTRGCWKGISFAVIAQRQAAVQWMFMDRNFLCKLNTAETVF